MILLKLGSTQRSSDRHSSAADLRGRAEAALAAMGPLSPIDVAWEARRVVRKRLGNRSRPLTAIVGSFALQMPMTS